MTSDACTNGSGARLLGRGELPSQRRHVHVASQVIPAPTEEWLEERKQRDQQVAGFPKHLWLIHGSLYDLSAYVDKHPGGKEWLQFMRGTDCTTEFETHHINMPKVAKILAKYRVGAVADRSKYDALAPYTWQENGFYATIRRKGAEILKANGGSGPTNAMVALSWSAVAAWFLAYTATIYFQSYVLAVLAGYLLFVLLGIGHNFFHQANTILRYASDFTLAAHHQWRISHAISHHTYPNQAVDVEASALEPYDTFIRSQKGRPLIFLFLASVLYTLLPLLDLARTVVGLIVGTVELRWEYSIRIAQLAGLLWFCGLSRGFALFFVMHAVCSWGLVLSSFLVHRTEYAWADGCQVVEADHEDFGEHILASTHHYRPPWGLVGDMFLAGSFGNHIIHHLFPTLDLSKQYLLEKAVEETCKEFKLPYKKRSAWTLLKSVAKMHYRYESEGLKYAPAADLLS